jgi:TonB family protein
MMRSFGILVVAMAFLLSVRGMVSAQVKIQPEVSSVVTEPKEIIPLDSLIHYPEIAKEFGLEGNVTLSAKVQEDSTTTQVEVVRSDDVGFNDEAIRVLKTARFIPASQYGKPRLPFWIIRTIHFRLKESEKPITLGVCRFGLPIEPRLLTAPLDSCVHYPELAKKNGMETRVILRVLVGADGYVKKINILWPPNDTIFTPEAIRIIKAAHFAPATDYFSRNDIQGWTNQTINFRLKE